MFAVNTDCTKSDGKPAIYNDKVGLARILMATPTPHIVYHNHCIISKTDESADLMKKRSIIAWKAATPF